jgi:hypothetical protein
MVEIISFEEAISKAADCKNKHLLLGNGFSRACRDGLFSYDKLFEQADFSVVSPQAHEAFRKLGTSDFEMVMNALRRASLLVDLYGSTDKELASKLKKDSEDLREVLVSVIAKNHPNMPSDISDEEYQACREFLKHFSDIYTVNYDLLLYWALMHDEKPPKVACDDGFRMPESGQEEWVTWDVNLPKQNIHYLHGALHIYEDGPEIRKFTWCNTQMRLIDQIRSAMGQNKFPLFVSEGSADHKQSKINRSSLLGRAYRSLRAIGGTLFLFGFSMSENDSHILYAIAKNKVENLYVALHGKPDSGTNRQIQAAVNRLIKARGRLNPKHSLTVTYFDAASAKVWG